MYGVPSRRTPQIRQAKLARELEASVSGEKALTARVTELEEEVRDVSSTTRGRIRWLESAGEQTKRRLEQLYRELETSVPLTVGTVRGRPACQAISNVTSGADYVSCHVASKSPAASTLCQASPALHQNSRVRW
jgi:hypothetical protein